MFVVQPRRGPMDLVRRVPAAAVDVGDESDPQAGERWREAGHRNLGAFDDQLMTLVEISIRARASDRADSSGRERFQHGAPGDCHRLI